MLDAHSALEALFDYIEASPSPFHAAAAAVERLRTAGFAEAGRSDNWSEFDFTAGLAVRDGGTVVAVRASPDINPQELRFTVIGAHTDSPNLRIRPLPDAGTLGYHQLGVEVYGGALLNSWLDRDLGLSGRVVVRDAMSGGTATVLWRCDRALLRVPQLAIHLDRDVNDGLKLDRQQHMTPVWGLGAPSADGFREFLAADLDVEPDAVLAWDVMAHDLTPPARLGRHGEMYAAARIDNLASCHAAIEALAGLEAVPANTAAVVVLFDHEEIGSDSATGAGSPILADALERIAHSLGGDREQYLRAVARSLCVSADGAHAVHPNYPERLEPGHLPVLNGGPVVKTNANVRYATDARTHARFAAACDAAGVPHQVYSHRGNLPCGSTIGPITASRLGMSVVDVGSPQLSMHSARELGGADDPAMLTAALGAFLANG
ncbi:M18 family aminopeptidase [Candidatus Poriferisodalis sp.]|uniref:M18 family aminopeptidase n=1 Tax=Candidatus Poriferisodalis sp. TaxID=3101277 RepID=UPI003B01F5E5